MPKGYNALNDMQVNHLESGICPKHGYWLTSEQCNCYPKETALMFAAEQTKNTDWEQDADRLHELLASDVHPVEEAYQLETSEAYKELDEMEYRKSQLPKNVIVSETWLKRNTHASPAEKENARMQGEMLKKIKSEGVDFSKVSEVVQPNELNLWNQKHGDYD